MTLATLTTPHRPLTATLPAHSDKNILSRVGQYEAWLDQTGGHWAKPDLDLYRDHLLERLAPSSVAAHLSTIRARYATLLRDSQARADLYTLAYAQLAADGHEATPANANAYVSEAVARIEAALHPDAARVKVVKKQDTADSEHLRLTVEQANTLLAAPGVNTLRGLRDTAMIAVMLCTGVREQELCNLEVSDLRQRLGGSLALLVREGKGAKQRLIPYGQLEWVLIIVDAWLAAAGVTEGVVFRGLYKGEKQVRTTALTTRAVQLILGGYGVTIDGDLVTVHPHDLRRTYARRLYEAGVDLVAIQQNLGHADTKTTLGYIGTLDADQRKPPAVYSFDMKAFKNRRQQTKMEL